MFHLSVVGAYTQMEVLKQCRGHFKGTITRAQKLVADITEEMDVEVLEVRLEWLEDIWKAFVAIKLIFRISYSRRLR